MVLLQTGTAVFLISDLSADFGLLGVEQFGLSIAETLCCTVSAAGYVRAEGVQMSTCCKFKPLKIVATAVASFACGSLITAYLSHMQEVRADSNRIFELMVYHTEPGKVPALESIFGDVSQLQARHGLNVIGYWVPSDESPAWKNTFVYLIAHPSQDDAKKNWESLHADPAFLPYRKAAVPLIERVNGAFHVDEVFMRPTDFSAMK